MRKFYLLFFLSLLSYQASFAQDVINPSVVIPEECTVTREGTTADGSNNFDRNTYRNCLTANGFSNNPFTGGDDIYRLGDRYDFSKAVTLKLRATSNSRDLDLFVMNGGTCIAASTRGAGNEDEVNLSSWNDNYRIFVDGFNSSQNGGYVLELIATCLPDETPPVTFPCDLSKRTLVCNSSVSGDTRNESDNLRLPTYNTGGGCFNFTGNTAANNPFTGNDVVYRLSGVEDGTSVTLRLNPNTDIDMFIYRCFDGIGTHCISAAGATGAINETVTIDWDNNYIIILDAPNPSQNGSYTLSAVCSNNDPCANASSDIDCDNLFFDYTGSNGSLRYEFSTNLSSSGTWVAIRNGTELNLGSGFRRTYTFPSSGEYTICYRYRDSNGCEVACCKTIFIGNPFDCSEILANKNGNNYSLFLNNINSSNIVQWVDDETGAVLNTNSSEIVIPVPTPGNCRNISVTYYDPFSECYRICCIEICENPCSPSPNNNITAGTQDCNFINYNYNTSIGGLSYRLNVPTNLPSNGTWEIVDNNSNITVIGSGRTITDYRFPFVGRFLICYKYRDSNGCELFCCRWVYIDNPLDCSQIIASPNGSNYVLSLSSVNSSDILKWVDDATGSVLNTSNNQIIIPEPAPNDCRYYSVTYYDPFCNCYRICCIRICGPTSGGGNCCPDGDASLTKITDLYKAICECGVKVYCYDGPDFSGYYVYSGYLCCSRGTGTIFDCQGNIRNIETVPPNPFFDNTIGDLVWDGCNNTGGPFVVTAPETTPSFLAEYPWLSDLVDFSNCSGTSIEIHRAGSSNFVYVITASASVLYNSNGATWCTSGPGLNCLDFYSNGMIDSWNCGGNFAPEPCEVNPENCDTERVTLPNTQGTINEVLEELQIYPNPSQGLIFIETPSTSAIKTVHVYNVSGQIVETFDFSPTDSEGPIPLDLSDYSGGMYLLQIESATERVTKRIVLE